MRVGSRSVAAAHLALELVLVEGAGGADVCLEQKPSATVRKNIYEDTNRVRTIAPRSSNRLNVLWNVSAALLAYRRPSRLPLSYRRAYAGRLVLPSPPWCRLITTVLPEIDGGRGNQHRRPGVVIVILTLSPRCRVPRTIAYTLAD